MSNMSYCRFRNTETDLDDCAEALEELLGGEAYDDEEESLSEEELSAAISLVQTCFDIVSLVSDHMGIDVFSEDADKFESEYDLALRQANKVFQRKCDK